MRGTHRPEVYILTEDNLIETALSSNYTLSELKEDLARANNHNCDLWVRVNLNGLERKRVSRRFSESEDVKAYLYTDAAWE